MGDNSCMVRTGSREAQADGPSGDSANDIQYNMSPPNLYDIDGRTWQYAVRQVVAIVNETNVDTEVNIEFQRIYEFDTLSGGGPLATANFHHAAVTKAESIKAIVPFGFLNRAAIFGAAEGGSDRVQYKSYMFGSNVILFDNDLTNYDILNASVPSGTDKRHLQRGLDMSDVELKRFISNIVTVSGGTISAKRSCDAKGKLKRRRREQGYTYVDNDAEDYDEDEDVQPPFEGCVKFTSFNRLNNSLQFTFNTQGNKHYFSANVILLKADDYCTNDLVYKRAAISSLCQCERPALVWRVCVLVTPINCASVEGVSHIEVTKVVMAAFTAFRAVYQHKRSTVDSRVAVIPSFLASPIPPFINTSTRPKRRRADNSETTLVPLCTFHRWLRAHSGSKWVVSSGAGPENLIRLMDRHGGRAVIVLRPILMTGTDFASAGRRSFVRFMTYEDCVKKTLRLTLTSLTNGLSDSRSDENCAVAYVRGKNDLIVFQRADSKFVREDDGGLIANEQTQVGGTAQLWRTLFEAPTCLYVDLGVLASMGFNIVGVQSGGRTFLHEDYNTRNTCTVFCSVLLRMVEDSTRRLINERDDDIVSSDQNAYTSYTEETDVPHGITVLGGKDNRFDSVTQTNHRPQTENSIRSRVRETVYNINDYWPGVNLVKTDFVDPELKHVCFAYFTGDGRSGMALGSLHAFSDYCLRHSVLPPPILFTVQRMVVKGLYA